MVKKKVTKKKASVKKVFNKRVSKVVSKPVVKQKVVQRRILVTPSKFRLVLKNLILFVLLAVISFIFFQASSNQMYIDFFLLLTWILGFISVAFLIALLVLLFLKVIRR